ncbi:hypothetical protein D3C84_819150 [compost metagenome]
MAKAEAELTAAQIADKLAKRLAGVAGDGEKDTPVSITISLPKSLIRELESRRLANKDAAAGPKTISGLIKAALEKDGYGGL